MLRLIYPNGLPVGVYPADPSVEFEAGMVCGLKQMGNDIFLTVSDGVSIQPYGIIDDVRSRAFSKPVVDEEIIVEAEGDEYGRTVRDEVALLSHPNIQAKSFASSVEVVLNTNNGAITIPKGTPLNYDNDGDGVLDSVRVICSYAYDISDFPGDDTTVGSGNMTAWITRGEYATDQYDTTVAYPLNGILYCGRDGRLTTRSNGPGIGMITGPPSVNINELQFLWF